MEGFTVVLDGGSSVELSGRRSRIMDRLRVNLKQHPATDTVAYKRTRDNSGQKLVASFNPDVFVDGLVDAEEIRMEINWWTHPPGYDDQFKFHYIESSGYDCGWHRQPHPDRSEIPFDHFQQRADPDDEYQYQGVDFIEENPVGLLWEITKTRLPKIVRSRWE